VFFLSWRRGLPRALARFSVAMMMMMMMDDDDDFD
jgi:hypothetical protein